MHKYFVRGLVLLGAWFPKIVQTRGRWFTTPMSLDLSSQNPGYDTTSRYYMVCKLVKVISTLILTVVWAIIVGFWSRRWSSPFGTMNTMRSIWTGPATPFVTVTYRGSVELTACTTACSASTTNRLRLIALSWLHVSCRVRVLRKKSISQLRFSFYFQRW